MMDYTIVFASLGSEIAEPVVSKGAFDKLVDAVGSSYLFKEYVSTWAAPFDNASFDAVLLIIGTLALAWSAFGLVMNLNYRRRVRKRQLGIEKGLRDHVRHPEKTETTDMEPSMELAEAEADKEPEQEEIDEETYVLTEEEDIPEPEEEDQPVVERLLTEKSSEDEELSEENTAFGSLIANLKQRQKQEVIAREIDDAAREATRENLKKLQSDMESAILENGANKQGKKDPIKVSDDLANAHKKAVREREKEKLKAQRVQKKTGRLKTPAPQAT